LEGGTGLSEKKGLGKSDLEDGAGRSHAVKKGIDGGRKSSIILGRKKSDEGDRRDVGEAVLRGTRDERLLLLREESSKKGERASNVLDPPR